MNKFVTIFLFLVALYGCETKPKGPIITTENVREELMRYGEENPENEVIIETHHGNMRLKLYHDTPLHRANFVKLIKEGFYEEAEFYRIVNEFMIQGGDLDQKLNYTIPAEFNPKYFHKKGALSMARVTENNPEMRSASTDFFIVHGGGYSEEDVELEEKNLGLTLTPEQRLEYLTVGGYMDLDQKYTVFGEVVDGFEVIDFLAKEKVYNEDKPLKKNPFKISLVEK